MEKREVEKLIIKYNEGVADASEIVLIEKYSFD